MAETAPRTNSRLENFEANKAAAEAESQAAERAAFDESLYGEAGSTDFSDEAKSRIEEADEYERHMERLASDNRSSSDRHLDRVESGEIAEHVDPDVEAAYEEHLEHEAYDRDAEFNRQEAERNLQRKIQENAVLRRMDNMAHEIARIRNSPATPETADRDIRRADELSDKLHQLLDSYIDTPDADGAVFDRILANASRAATASPETSSATDGGVREFDPSDPEAQAKAIVAILRANPKMATADVLEQLRNIRAAAVPPEDTEAVRLQEIENRRNSMTKEETDADRNAAYDEAFEHNNNLDQYAADQRDLARDNARVHDVELAHGEAIEVNRANMTPAEIDLERKAAELEAHDINDKLDDDFEDDDDELGDTKWWKSSPYLRFTLFLQARKNDIRDRLGSDNEHSTRNRVLVGLGVVAVVAIAIYSKQSGHHHGGGGGNSVVPSSKGDTPKPSVSGNDNGASLNHRGLGSVEHPQTGVEHFSDAARTITSGEGWDQQLGNLGFTPEQTAKALPRLLDSKDPGIQSWVYRMANGDPGISHTGILSQDTIESIMKLRS